MALSGAEKQARWRANNPETSLQRDRDWRKNNIEKARQKNRTYYADNKETEIARNKKFYQDNKETQRVRHRNNRHHITQDWFDSKLIEQNDKCAICRKPFIDTPHIDHNHNCCKPSTSCEKCRRDLLCKDCNLGLGRFHDDPVILGRAIDYVAKHKENQ